MKSSFSYSNLVSVGCNAYTGAEKCSSIKLAYSLPHVPPSNSISEQKGSHEEEVGLPLSLHLTRCLSSRDVLAGDVLLDDRDSWTIGKRLKDLDHMGVPFVVVAGKRVVPPVPQPAPF